MSVGAYGPPVFFCAGARNQLLLDAFGDSALFMEVDERAASFKALGACKASGKVSIICTTSGTAVSECLSAMIEAYYSEAPLVLVSADRPKKLQATGAPQTIDHQAVTNGFTRSFFELTLEEFKSFDYSQLKFPAHINVRITQPSEENFIASKEFPSFKAFMSEVRHPLFIFSHEQSDMRSLVTKFLPYGIPFYAEVGSGAKDLSAIKTEKKLLSLLEAQVFDGIVRIGHTPLGKIWRLLESRNLPVYNFDSRNLKGLSHGTVEAISVAELENTSIFWDSLPKHEHPPLDESQKQLAELCLKYPKAEISLIKKIHDLLPAEAKVFLGNSLPIRYFELVQNKPFQIMANRGVNGIDGQMATAQGWSLATQDTVYCILGDMTFCYDLSSLLNFPRNFKCIVINNSGGRIFEVLKMDRRLVMEHDQTFKSICQGFKLQHHTSLEHLDQAQVLEIIPDLNESRQLLEEWQS